MNEYNSELRVAHVIGKMMGGGVESVVMNYFRNMDRSKVQFDFIVDSDSTHIPEKEILDLGGRVYKVPPYQNIFGYLSALYKLFRVNKYKIVHSHMNTLNIFPMFIAKLCSVPVRISHNHSTYTKGEGFKNFVKLILKPFSKLFPTHYFACSEKTGKWLFGEKFYNSGRVTVIKNAFDINKFAFNEYVRKQIRIELNVDDKCVYGCVGRFVYQKNHEFLIDVFKNIFSKDNSAVLLLIGDGETENMLVNKINDLGLNESVILTGHRTDVNRFYQAMDCVVMPSRCEGLGLVAIEAQCAGVKTVVSDAFPDDVKITDNIISINLNENAQSWADKILGFKSEIKRENTASLIEKAGYSIKSQADKLFHFYLSA